MAVDKRGRKLPKGIQQRYNDFEGRFMYQGKRYLVHGKTVTETQKAMTELKYQLEHELYIEEKNIILDEWFETWINDYKKNRVKIGTLQVYQDIYGSCIKKRMGNKKITAIRGEHIQRIYNELFEEGYSSSTIEIVRVILGGCFKQAVINGLVAKNPTALAEMPRKKAQKGRVALTKEQQALFMEYAKESYLYNLFAVMLRTGLRSGEIRGLKYTDIDKKNNVLHIERTLKYITGKGLIEEPPKTKTSKRDIPLTNDLLQILEAQRKYWGFKVEKMDRYLFCDEVGGALKRYKIANEIKSITERIHKDGHEFPYITPHVFRHTFATRAIEAGMKPQVLKTILGHSSLAMTMDLYSHVLPDTKMEEMEKIANAF